MATATARVEQVLITTYKEQKVYTLELSEREAKTLYALTGSVGGDPHGPRGALTSMREALLEAGLGYQWSNSVTESGILYMLPEYPVGW